jgi:hypothetical protein
MNKRYCEMCDEWLSKRECPKCGMKTLPPAKAELAAINRELNDLDWDPPIGAVRLSTPTEPPQ